MSNPDGITVIRNTSLILYCLGRRLPVKWCGLSVTQINLNRGGNHGRYETRFQYRDQTVRAHH
jgi:hypothetical protein